MTMQIVREDTGEIAGKTENQALVLVDDKFTFTSTGLVIRGDPTLEECEEVGQCISLLGKMAPIWLGDLLNYMENRWGEGYAQVLDATGYAYQTVVNAKSVMGRVPPEVRREGLHFSHYEAAASLPLQQQERLLERAVEEGLRTSDIRREARRIKRHESQGFLPASVKMTVNMTFEVPANLNGKLRSSLERLTERLTEWDIECKSMNIKREGK
jgi:hypothetical protein